jgi:hypothetical protein
MNGPDVQKIVEEVTRLVLAQVQQQQTAAEATEGMEHCLVVGDIAAVPEKLEQGRVLHPLEEYERCGNILRYRRVIVIGLTLVQLADIAQGRPGDSGSCAVVNALLNGVEVVMPETALPHRKFAGKGSNGLYALLEGYVRTLQTFGVKLLGQAALVMPVVVPVKPPKYQAPAPEPVRGSAKPNCQRLITETDAMALAATAEGTVCIPADAILTPSARDVFTRARLEIQRCDG